MPAEETATVPGAATARASSHGSPAAASSTSAESVADAAPRPIEPTGTSNIAYVSARSAAEAAPRNGTPAAHASHVSA